MNIAINLIFFLQLFVSCHQRPESEDYLIPQGYTGRITIIFNQKQGTPAQHENGRRVYKIPENGILLTQFKDEYGFVDHHYYYVESSGKKTAVPIYKYKNNKDGATRWIVKDKNKTGIFLDGTTGQYANDGIAPFQLFIVSTYKGLDSFYTKEYQRDFDERINKLIASNL